ncbi:hypothetical protein [Natrinema gelatinilyticum]|uniref:hypothetical protein n=1 Tax=Natrinema gelatinilyticum TaxID=2961571 RepID=UPI0020C4F392|nr:hypothetical protein [Natrinema gelatinilyticum]
MSHPIRAARRRIQAEHESVVDGIGACADAIVEPWDTARTTNREAVVGGLHRSLEETGIHGSLPDVLADVVSATGFELQACPVPAPPYVVVTSRGPILRATIDPGRLVIRFDAFDVVRGSHSDRRPAYRRRDDVRLTVVLE